MRKTYLLAAIALVGLFVPSQQGKSHSRRRHYNCPPDPTLTKRLTDLEMDLTTLTSELYHQSQLLDAYQNDIQESSAAQWGGWAGWSGCTFSCTSENEGRTQTRERTRTLSSGATQAETESRPCNSVQFAKCINDDGPGDDYAVAYDYRDTVAMAICTGINTDGKWIYAIRRACGSGPSCDEICTGLTGAAYTCLNSFHIYSPNYAPALSHDEVGQKSVYTYRYNSCSSENCGPNYCCCRRTVVES